MKIKVSLLIILIELFYINKIVYSQINRPYTIPCKAGHKTVGNISMSYSVGQTSVHTVQGGNKSLSQGFQQPEVQIRTGVISGSFCPGSSVVVSFYAYGIIGATNIFTAQLSDTSGSFSNPVNIGSITGNASGNINCFIPIATAAGNTYRIRVVSSLPVFNGSDNGSNIIIDPNNCNLNLNLKLYIEGYYTGGGLMKPVLQNQNVITSNTICDIIIVELHNPNPPYEVVTSTSTFMNTNGTASCSFSANAGSYYIVVKHRNALATWSTIPKLISSTAITYDFTTAANKAYGGNMKNMGGNKYAFFSGDFNFDENIDLLDATNLENDINNFSFGNFATDVNGDGNVDLLDDPVVQNNINNFIFSIHP